MNLAMHVSAFRSMPHGRINLSDGERDAELPHGARHLPSTTTHGVANLVEEAVVKFLQEDDPLAMWLVGAAGVANAVAAVGLLNFFGRDLLELPVVLCLTASVLFAVDLARRVKRREAQKNRRPDRQVENARTCSPTSFWFGMGTGLLVASLLIYLESPAWLPLAWGTLFLLFLTVRTVAVSGGEGSALRRRGRRVVAPSRDTRSS